MKLVDVIASSFILRMVTGCPSPPIPQGAYVETYNELNTSLKYSCFEGMKRFGEQENHCTNGTWDQPQVICSRNAALYVQTKLGDAAFSSDTMLPVDGTFHPDKSKYFCQKVVYNQQTWAMDLGQPYNILELDIFTHSDSGTSSFIEVRIGNQSDTSSNQMCWFLPSLEPGKETRINCSEVISGRYISLKFGSLQSPVYLCEVEVWTGTGFQEINAKDQSLQNCFGDQPMNRDVRKVGDSCVYLGMEEGKMNFKQAKSVCSSKGMNLVYLTDYSDLSAYQYIKSELGKYSKERRMKLYIWTELMSVDGEWRWFGENSSFHRQPRSIQPNTVDKRSSYWGIGEPRGGDCMALDSSMRMSWNAIGCMISGIVACQSPVLYCTAPSVSQGLRLDGRSRAWYPHGSTLTYVCDKGYKVQGQDTLECSRGTWNSQDIKCVPDHNKEEPTEDNGNGGKADESEGLVEENDDKLKEDETPATADDPNTDTNINDNDHETKKNNVISSELTNTGTGPIIDKHQQGDQHGWTKPDKVYDKNKKHNLTNKEDVQREKDEVEDVQREEEEVEDVQENEVEPDGQEVEPDGQEVEPDGQEVEPDGQEVEPNVQEVEPDVQEVDPDGQEVEPDGQEVDPDGQEVGPDGQKEAVRANGDGRIIHSDPLLEIQEEEEAGEDIGLRIFQPGEGSSAESQNICQKMIIFVVFYTLHM